MEPRKLIAGWDAELGLFAVRGEDDDLVGVGLSPQAALTEAEAATRPVEWDEWQWCIFDADGFLLGCSDESPEAAREDAIARARARTLAALDGR